MDGEHRFLNAKGRLPDSLIHEDSVDHCPILINVDQYQSESRHRSTFIQGVLIQFSYSNYHNPENVLQF